MVLAFPCNQFGAQEPWEPSKIREFVTEKFGVTFPMFEKISVNGSSTHPIFSYLKKQDYGNLMGIIKWNFTKFLIDRDGKPVNRYEPNFAADKMESRIVELLQGPSSPLPAPSDEKPPSDEKQDASL